DMHHLPRVVPFVDGVVDVEPLVALKADQSGAENFREHLGDFRLAHARLPLEKERAAELQGQEDGGREAARGAVSPLPQSRLEGVDGREPGRHRQEYLPATRELLTGGRKQSVANPWPGRRPP